MNNNQSTDNTVQIYDCVVVGGGISGISFAHYLQKQGGKVLVLEKAKQHGGQIQSVVSSEQPHYWNELGAHTCYNSYTGLLSIVQDVNALDSIQPLDSFKYVLYSSGKIKSIFSAVSVLPCAFGIFKMLFSDKQGKTVREYFCPIVGKSNYDRLFTNAFKAVLSQKADDYPAEMFLKRRKDKDKTLSRRFTFKKGLSSFIDVVVEKDNLEIICESEVIDLKKNDDFFVLETMDRQKIYARNVALATDPQTSSVLLKTIEPELSETLSSIGIFRSESLSVTLPIDKLAIEKVAGIIPLSDQFLSAVSRDLIEDPRLRSFAFHFEKGRMNRKEKLKLICQILNVSETDILEIKEADHVLPSVRLEHLNMDKMIEEKRKDEKVFILGNYFQGLSLEDCVNRSKAEYERFINKNY